MTVVISPLELMLDTENPRFVVLDTRSQENIRNYLLMYEDACQLASAINEYGGLLPGERIVVLEEDGQYVVVEGNRRTCALQLLLSRDLIPASFSHRIPQTSEKVIGACSQIEVDVLPDRDAALALMSRRHIEGVKQWKPLAKKQFFAASYNDGHGKTIHDLSVITDISENTIRSDIRDYKLFKKAYEEYRVLHPEFNREIVVLKTDPFWRIFKAKFEYPDGQAVSAKDFFCLSYDDAQNTLCNIDDGLFKKVALLVFKHAIVEESVTTRNVLPEISGMPALLDIFIEKRNAAEHEERSEQNPPQTDDPDVFAHNSDADGDSIGGTGNHHTDDADPRGGQQTEDGDIGGPTPGGPGPRTFFETLSWNGKLDPAKPDHQGLILAVNELFNLSRTTIGRRKAYTVFPIATGMVLRTAYEQALRLRLKQAGLWGIYMATLQDRNWPTLKSMEDFVCAGAHKETALPTHDLILAYDRVIAASHRDFLNANIHYPGNINVTPDSLEAIAAAGMFTVIQGIINLSN